ncbi:hypothetical protein KVT40_006066 [Elsinoe batatas]|uniref:Macro domain-containing protein n=1 Tax=Elsinoe batatas TaxID=2601811 RepID=A0A8K0PBD9_9PEZI|nr:hypothetical protein KVT40_006066 [Elsinoe batatas]
MRHLFHPTFVNMASKILDIAAIPSVTGLYAFSKIAPTDTAPAPLHTLSTPPRLSTFNDRIHLVRYDITKLRLTAIVNAANSSLLGGGGVDGAIHRAAGPKLYDACERLDGCDTGDAKITRGYELPAKYVIHAVGPIYGVEKRKKQGREEELLARCYTKSLELAKGLTGKKQVAQKSWEEEDEWEQIDREEAEGVSVGFSGLSTGIYGYPKEQAAKVAVATVVEWLRQEREAAIKEQRQEGVQDVVFVCFEQKDFDAYVKWLPQFCPKEEETSKDNESSTRQVTEQANATETATDASTANSKEDIDIQDAAEESKKDEKLDLPSPPSGEPKVPGEPDSKKVKI